MCVTNYDMNRKHKQ